MDGKFAHPVYEWMDVTLAEIQSTPIDILTEFYIVAICNEVGPLLLTAYLPLTVNLGPSRYPNYSSDTPYRPCGAECS